MFEWILMCCQKELLDLPTIVAQGKTHYFLFSMPPTALLGTGGNTFWTGLMLDPEHGWKWSNGKPYRYMKWDSGRCFLYFNSVFIPIYENGNMSKYISYQYLQAQAKESWWVKY